MTASFFSPSGITKWETLLPSLNIFGNGTVCSADADGLEPVPLSHLPLQDLLCSEFTFPLLPVSIQSNAHACVLVINKKFEIQCFLKKKKTVSVVPELIGLFKNSFIIQHSNKCIEVIFVVWFLNSFHCI